MRALLLVPAVASPIDNVIAALWVSVPTYPVKSIDRQAAATLILRFPDVAVATTLSAAVGTRPSTQVFGAFQFPPASEIVKVLAVDGSVNVQPLLPPPSVEWEPAYQVAAGHVFAGGF